jgi:hypothetical protein
VEVSLALVANAAAPIVRLQLAQPHGRLLRLVCCKARLLDRVQFVDEHDERLAHATAEFRLLSTVQQAIRRVSDVKFAAAGRTMPLVEHACVHRFVPELTAAAIRMAISPVAESAISSSAAAAAAASSAGAHQRSCWKFPLLSAGGAHVARRIDRLRRVSPKLHGALRRHQQEGAVWALQRHGRVLLADEMGVGKTIQALAIAACYSDEWPLLIVAPAAMRLVWAGQVERCFPCLSPSEILVVASSSHRLRRSDSHIKVVITSFRMAGILFEDGDPEFAQRDWGVVVVDEAHQHMRTPAPRSKGSSCVQCLARIVAHAKRALLLSGTPSQKAPRDVWLQVDCLRSGLLGGKRSFEEHYCLHSGHTAAPGQRRAAPANGMRFGQELHALLRTVVMLRRLKKDAGVALPRKFRRVVMLRLPSKGLVRGGPSIDSLSESHLAGLAKVDIACDWIAAKLRRIVAELGDAGSSAVGSRRCPKIIVFAHHVAVMDKICTRMDELLSSLRSFDGRDTGGGSGSDDGSGSNGSSDGTVALHLAALPSVIRFDGVLNDHERQERLTVFQASRRLAICAVSITAGGTGIDLSQASHAFFVELPQRISDALQVRHCASVVFHSALCIWPICLVLFLPSALALLFLVFRRNHDCIVPDRQLTSERTISLEAGSATLASTTRSSGTCYEGKCAVPVTFMTEALVLRQSSMPLFSATAPFRQNRRMDHAQVALAILYPRQPTRLSASKAHPTMLRFSPICSPSSGVPSSTLPPTTITFVSS